ncbi:ArnT family glycosyltransferase [Natrialbaceae archaeon GCM10025810]|uniref:ArnT family glycosyltransferase n=1 Tax=Halovalidus salilacus TaxID=3075124 RepID=UPI003616BFEE
MSSASDPNGRRTRIFGRLRRRFSVPTDREPRLALLLSVLTGVVVFFVAAEVFPYHSINDDEGVYLTQAAMLLEGQLEIRAGELADAFRPWFFVDDGGRLYPKYTPVPAAMFAVAMALVGEPRVALAAIAAGNVALVYVLASMIFDRRVGLVAATVFAASPFALLTSSVFLPYAPTTLLNLLFAVLYLRGVRDAHLPSAAGAGVATGLAFFARPYTAVLFAAPFIAHALWTVGRSLRRGGTAAVRRPVPGSIRRNAATAALGSAFVGLTLAYNARVTGSPLLFPYEAFAPLDGPGFGYREIEGHSMEYTLEVALEANGYVLWYYATRWFTAGPIGMIAALSGLALALRRWIPSGIRGDGDDHGRTAGLVLAGTLVTVPLGNLAFWGNRNVLATMDDPTNGLLSHFGPFYHFDTLAPLSIFAGFALVTGWRWLRAGRLHDRLADRTSRETARRIALAVLVSSVLVVGAVNATVVSTPLERNAAYTDKFEEAYEPFEERDLEDALVFLPTPYGGWQNHPFQPLRNDPGLDGEVVYALDGVPERDFEVLDAYPDRTPYRYAYHGDWTPSPDDHVTPTLEELSVREGEAFESRTTVGVPSNVDELRLEIETGSGERASHDTYVVAESGDEVDVDWRIEDGRAALTNVTTDAGDTEGPDGDATVGLEGVDDVHLSVTLVQSDGSSLTYQQEAAVRSTGGDGDDARLEVIWPPERSVCTLVTHCGDGDRYIPGEPDLYFDGVSFETRLDAVEAGEERDS